VVFSLLVIGLVAVVFAAGTDRPEGRSFATRSVTVARHGMVAAAHPLAVQVGIDVLKRGGALFKDKPGFAEVFLPGGKPPAEGEPFANPALARTLAILAAEGREAYYRGRIAEKVVAYSKTVGDYQAVWRDPATGVYFGASESRKDGCAMGY